MMNEVSHRDAVFDVCERPWEKLFDYGMTWSSVWSNANKLESAEVDPNRRRRMIKGRLVLLWIDQIFEIENAIRSEINDA